MYKPSRFAEDRIHVLHDHIRKYPLGTIITADAGGVTANLIPFSLHDVGYKGTLRCHMAKGNTHIEKIRKANEVLVVFHGPQSYVSPSHYPTKKIDAKVVPTWNYSMVQVRGVANVIEDGVWIYQQITDLTNAQEKNLVHPWQVTDAPADYVEQLQKGLIGIEILIQNIEGKFKLSQNQPPENKAGVESGFRQEGKTEMAELISKITNTESF